MLNSTHLVGFGTKVPLRPLWIDCAGITSTGDGQLSSVIGPDGSVYFAYALVVTAVVSLEVVKIGSNNAVIWKKNIYRVASINSPKLHAISPDGSKLAISTGTFGGSTTDDFGIIQLNTSDGTIHTQAAYGSATYGNSIYSLIYNPSGDILASMNRGGTNNLYAFTKFSGVDLSVTWSTYLASVVAVSSPGASNGAAIAYDGGYIYSAFGHSNTKIGVLKLNETTGALVSDITTSDVLSALVPIVGSILLDSEKSIYVGFGSFGSSSIGFMAKFNSSYNFQWSKRTSLNNSSESWYLANIFGEIHSFHKDYSTGGTGAYEHIFDENGSVLKDIKHEVSSDVGAAAAAHVSINPNVNKKVIMTMEIVSGVYTPYIAILPIFETKEYVVDTDIYFNKESFTTETLTSHTLTMSDPTWVVSANSWSAGTASPFSIQDSVQTYTPTYLT